MDRVRVMAFVRRLERGEDEVDAFWAVASDPKTGFSRYRDTPQRPTEVELRRKLAALLTRVAPDVVARSREIAMVRLSALSEPALDAVAEVVTGDFSDGQAARARLDAARIIFGSLGIREQGAAAASAQASVHVSLGDGLRAMRHVQAEVRDAGEP